jgi:hypothetical protein
VPIICAGAVYGYGTISEDLKHELQLNDDEEQRVSILARRSARCLYNVRHQQVRGAGGTTEKHCPAARVPRR